MGKGIVFIVAAAALSGAILMHNMKRTEYDTDVVNSGYENGMIAREIARSALNRGIAKATGEFDTIGASASDDEVNAAYQGGAYDLSFERLSYGTVKVSVEGRFGEGEAQERHRISTTLTRESAITAAIVVESDTATAFFDGTSFLVDGTDRLPPSMTGQPFVASPQSGITANLVDVRNAFRTALGAARVDRVIGVNGHGDIVSMLPRGDLQAVYQEALLERDRTVSAGTVSGVHSYGSAASPQIVVINGNATITGTFTGVGVLAVEGNLTVTGTLTWEGLVMVKKETSMVVDYGGTATVYGSLVMLQGSSAFTMPATGQLKVKYLYSSAGYQSAVYIEPRGEPADMLFSAGSNRNGDQMTVQERTYPKGQQMNFYIYTYASSGSPREYKHYARGHNAPDGTPYARVTQTGTYKWEVEFEDLNVESGHTPDWDYNDQVIEIEVIPSVDGEPVDEPFDVWWEQVAVQVVDDPGVWSNLAAWFGIDGRGAARAAVAASAEPLLYPASWRVATGTGTPAFGSFDLRAGSFLAGMAGRVAAGASVLGGAAFLPPSTPSLSSPSHQATNVATSVRLDWNGVSGASRYRLQVSTDDDFSPTVVNETSITSSYYDVSGLQNNTRYYWRVRACTSSSSSSCSSWSSSSRYFTTVAAAPAVPTPSSPANSASDVGTGPTLDWNNVTGASSYTVQLDDQNNFSSPLVNQTVSSSQYSSSGLANSTTYYWRVRACNGSTCSNWSSTFSFTTEAPDPWLVCTSDASSTKLCFRMRDTAKVYYSREAIERLKGRLMNLGDYKNIKVTDQWVESTW